MRKEWGYLLLTAVLSGCGGGDTPKPEQPKDDGGTVVPTSYQVTFSGKVFAKAQTAQQLTFFAGDTQLGQGASQADGTYSIALTVDQSAYDQLQTVPLRVVASAGDIQLVALSSGTSPQTVKSLTRSVNLSSFSTAAYVLADLDQDGVVTAGEWDTYQAASEANRVNPNLLKLATSFEAVIAEQIESPTKSVLRWLQDLKSTTAWDQWLTAHEATLTTVWETTKTNAQLRQQAGNYLKGKALEDFTAADVLVKAPTLASCQLMIHITDVGANPHQVAVGQQLQLATDITDNLTGNVIQGRAAWSSSDAQRVNVNATGGITAKAAGKADITARYQHGQEACADEMTLTVIGVDPGEPVLSSIQFHRWPGAVNAGVTIALSVTGTWSDDTTTDISDQAVWRVAPDDLAVMNGHQLTALKAGVVTLTASFEGKTVTQQLTIKPPVPMPPELTAIAIEGSTLAKLVGEQWQLTAMGSYDNNSSANITAEVDWLSSDPAIATVSAQGLVTANAVGTTSITATKGAVSQQINMTVKTADPVVEALSVNGDFSDFNKGESTSIAVIADYSNGRIEDVTNQVTWEMSQAGIVEVSQSRISALREGSVTLTATWTLAGKTVQATLPVTVLPPSLVSIEPNILGGELRMQEGEVRRAIFTVTFSDQSEETYDNITIAADTDSSGLPVASYKKMNPIFGLIRAQRAGNTTLSIYDLPQRVLDQLPVEVVKQDRAEVKLVVDDNPDVYQWHREVTPFIGEQFIVSTQNVLCDNKVYRFSHKSVPVDSDWNAQSVLLSTFDGDQHTNSTLVLGTANKRGMISNQMVDGGGHGYYLLIAPDEQGVRAYYIYNLFESRRVLHTVDLTGAPGSLLTTGDTVQPFGFTAEGHLTVLDNTDATKFQVYMYRPQAGQPGKFEWVAGDTVVGEGLRFIQMPSVTEHLVLFEQGSTANVEPKYHFINRTTGQVDQVVQWRYPDSAVDTHCSGITLLPGSTLAELKAFCTVKDAGNTAVGYWLWEDLSQPPYEIALDLTVGDSYQGGDSPILTRTPDGTLLATGGFIQEQYNSWMQLHQVTSGTVATEPLYQVSEKSAAPIYSQLFPLGETANVLQTNPNVEGELLMLTNHGMAVKSKPMETWETNVSMYDLPQNISETQHLYYLNKTWYIIPNDLTKDIWRFQMRDPNVVQN
ncbi:Ig-like domain-containing protein [Photobacterium sp. TY1-4]|uniref:Ig-like domain-containing protein n=1 Tax=Photobacterium sp. TY1-4 TaxID=2899122 RepID=UPI0021BEE8BF|nr:Ig-like domain-containing protein [Photobacterium sp. TY1-4]UXI03479.1 Ig-like domain-containing protein [Photobacterium sp. TY1-4]